MTNYEDFASLATWLQNGQKAPEPAPLEAYIGQAIEANEAPKAVETAQEAPTGAIGDRTNPGSRDLGDPDPLANIKRIIGQTVDNYGQSLDPNFDSDA